MPIPVWGGAILQNVAFIYYVQDTIITFEKLVSTRIYDKTYLAFVVDQAMGRPMS